LSEYAVPLKPMLGCIAVAPPIGEPAAHTGDFGAWGGNLVGKNTGRVIKLHKDRLRRLKRRN